MNRKLQHTMTALSATAAVFSLMLIAGGPAPAPTTAALPPPAAILVMSAEAAGTAVDTLEGIDPDPAAATPRQPKRSRATLALPYFSFAQGLRQVAGS